MASKNSRKPAVKNINKKAAAKVVVNKPVTAKPKAAVVKVSPAARVQAAKASTVMPAPSAKPAANRDPRVPAPGTVQSGVFKGREYKAKVLDNGFSYEGRSYKSLSAIGKEITQAACDGFAFFHSIPKA